LAQRSQHYALVRSMATNSNGHEEACHMLLTGRLDFPPGFSLNKVPSALSELGNGVGCFWGLDDAACHKEVCHAEEVYRSAYGGRTP